MTQRFPGVKVLFMSGYTRNAVVHEGRLDQDVALLEELFAPDALLRKIRDTLDGQTPSALTSNL
jgi:hypothetical protein